MSLIREQAAFLRDLRRLLEFAEGKHFLVTGGELERTPEIQARHRREGPTMDSMHLRRCAIDLNFFVEREGRTEWVHSLEQLEAVGAHWESLDPRNRWGGHGKGVLEISHFERDLGAWPSSSASVLAPPAAERETTAVSTPERPAAVTGVPPAGQRSILRRGSGARQEILVLQEKLAALKLLERTSGEYDAATEKAVVEFQRQHRLVADGIAGPKTWGVLDSVTSGSTAPANLRWLGDADLEQAAQELGVDLAAMRAVYQVESNGRGFVDDQPKILFEGHVFWRQLKVHGLDPQHLAGGNPDILYPKWTREHYGDQAHERNRLRRAEAIHESAARESASWGLFQIMGFHWQTLSAGADPPRYASVDEFVACMRRHERDQLEAFCLFLRVTRSRGQLLVDLLRRLDWPAFAFAYNGPGYRQNAYDDRLRAAYLKFKAQASA